ncbi:MAG: hypothetical protein ABIQ98_00390 [Sphingomicrobium sp.]
MVDVAIATIGWLSAGLILSAYFLLTAGRLAANSAAYQWLNVAGALGFIVNSGWNGAIPSATLNVVWAGIGLVALIRMGRAKAPATKE